MMLYRVQQELRLCAKASPTIALIGHSTDLASYSHALAKAMMTPRDEFLEKGVQYLGLGLAEEKYMAPYLWKFPSIMFLDYEHNQRSSMRILKYTNLDLTLYADDELTIGATVGHLKQLRQLCQQKNIRCGLTDGDLSLLDYFDQNSDSAYKIFSEDMIELLRNHLPLALGTRLYIQMIFHLMQPYSGSIFNPVEALRSVGKGLTMLRLPDDL